MMRTVTKLGIFIIAALRLCAPPAAADRLTLTSSNPTALEMDQMVARDRGFFARENIDLDVTYMTPDLVIKALLAGTVDLARSGSHFGVIAAARGGELKIIGGSNYGYPYQVISQPQFKSLADLKGQKIAGASLASITTTIFKDVMQRQGVAPTAYTLLLLEEVLKDFKPWVQAKLPLPWLKRRLSIFGPSMPAERFCSTIPTRSRTCNTLPTSRQVNRCRKIGRCSRDSLEQWDKRCTG